METGLSPAGRNRHPRVRPSSTCEHRPHSMGHTDRARIQLSSPFLLGNDAGCHHRSVSRAVRSRRTSRERRRGRARVSDRNTERRVPPPVIRPYRFPVRACAKQRTRVFTVSEVKSRCLLQEFGSSWDMNCFSLSRYCA